MTGSHYLERLGISSPFDLEPLAILSESLLDAADLAFLLWSSGVRIITAASAANREVDADWVFSPTDLGVQMARTKGARVFWLHTARAASLLKSERLRGMSVISQPLETLQLYTDKRQVKAALSAAKINVPQSISFDLYTPDLDVGVLNKEDRFIVKPAFGRHSEGVSRPIDGREISSVIARWMKARSKESVRWLPSDEPLIVERYIDGPEFSVSVLPPGSRVPPAAVRHQGYWSATPILRPLANAQHSAHEHTHISQTVLDEAAAQCAVVGRLIGAKAPLRMDVKIENSATPYIVDVNLKTRLSDGARTSRSKKSLTAQSIERLGVSYPETVLSFLNCKWDVDAIEKEESSASIAA